MSLLGLDSGRTAWWVVGAVLGAALLWVLHRFVGTFVFAVFIYYATRPFHRRVSNRVVRQPSLAAASTLLALVAPLLVLLVYTANVALQEYSRFTRQADLGPLEQQLQPYVNASAVVQDPGTLLNDPDLLSTAGRTLDAALGYLGFIGTGLLHMFVMVALAFYLLRDGPRLSRWVYSRFGDDRGVLESYLRAVDRDLSNIFFGNLLNAVITGVVGVLVYSVLNLFAPAGQSVPYPALVGVLAGAASLVPVVGMKLVYVPVAGYLLYDAAVVDAGPLWFVAAFVALSFVVVDAIPDLVLRPYVSSGFSFFGSADPAPSGPGAVSRGNRRIHVGMLMFAYIFGPLLFGWYGIFLGPLLLVLVLQFAWVVLPELLRGERIEPFSVDPTYLTGETETVQSPGARTAGAADTRAGTADPDAPTEDTPDGPSGGPDRTDDA